MFRYALLPLINFLIGASLALADTRQDCVRHSDLDLQVRACSEIVSSSPTAAWAYVNRSWAHLDKGDYDRTINDASRAIELDARRVAAYNNRAVAYERKGEYERALDFAKAIETDPLCALCYNGRAWTYFRAGKAEQGLPDVEKALSLQSSHAAILDTRAHLLEALGRREEAVADFRRALERDPKLAESIAGLKRLGGGP